MHASQQQQNLQFNVRGDGCFNNRGSTSAVAVEEIYFFPSHGRPNTCCTFFVSRGYPSLALDVCITCVSHAAAEWPIYLPYQRAACMYAGEPSSPLPKTFSARQKQTKRVLFFTIISVYQERRKKTTRLRGNNRTGAHIYVGKTRAPARNLPLHYLSLLGCIAVV